MWIKEALKLQIIIMRNFLTFLVNQKVEEVKKYYKGGKYLNPFIELS